MSRRCACGTGWKAQRAELVGELGDLPRPTVPEPEERQDSEEQKAVNELADSLCAGLPDNIEELEGDERGRWLLAQLLNWHRREGKSFWWRYFYLRDELTDEERREESDALAELTFEDSWPDPRPKARSTIYRFRFPPQDHAIKLDKTPHDPETEKAVGTAVHIDDEEGVIDIRRGNNQPPPTPTSLIPFEYFQPKPKPESLQQLARWVLEYRLDGAGPYQAARDLLARRPPRLGQEEGQRLLNKGDDAQDAARRLVAGMDESYLAVQGPPGSGKSTVGAEMIVDLVAAGKRIGVTANSHKVIGELLAKVARVAGQRGVDVAIGQRSFDEPTYPEPST